MAVAVKKATLIIGLIVVLLIIVIVGVIGWFIGKSHDSFPAKTCDNASYLVNPDSTLPTTGSTSFSPNPWSSYRLPLKLKPNHYVVDLQPHLEPDSTGLYLFSGTSTVHFEVKSSTKYIILHSYKLTYLDVDVYNQKGNVMESSYEPQPAYQYLVVTLMQDMKVGNNYSLTTRFYGELINRLNGLYRSTYQNAAGNIVTIASTQMQATDARRAFPCFDEPALKATFDIYLRHKDPYHALSNMPIKKTEVLDGDWKRSEFERTPKMSTYLLAFVVSDLSYVEHTNSKDKFQVRIYARSSEISNGNGDYASVIAPEILNYYESFFNVSYPLPKSDQVAITEFPASAMENWGLVIYGETTLLFNTAVNSAENKQRIASVIAHELAHQWFGNLISPDWWDELWLNEGFANYVEYIGTAAVEPSWRMEDQFLVMEWLQAMQVDSLVASRPIVAKNVETPAEITSLFDVISYKKGACILRMIHEFMGDTAFKLGVKNYLEDFSYQSVNHYQLFQYWETAMRASSMPTASFPPNGFIDSMNTWILQMGYPVLTMKRENATSEKVLIQQERFLLDSEADLTAPESIYSYKWDVPLWYAIEGNTNNNLMWLKRNQSVYEIAVPETKYFIGNYKALGFYRVNYDLENWEKIIEQLSQDSTVIDVKSRGQLIDDAFNLARGKLLEYSTALKLTLFLRKDLDYIPWKSAINSFSYFTIMFERSKVYDVYRKYILHLIEPLYNKIAWKDVKHHIEQLQSANAIRIACSHGHVECIAAAKKQFEKWMTGGVNRITPNLRAVVYDIAIVNGGVEEWDFAWKHFINETNLREKANLGKALSVTRKLWIINRFLGRMFNESFVRKQEVTNLLSNLCENEYARDITWNWIQQEWDYIYQTYGQEILFSSIIKSCTTRFSTKFELKQLEKFKDSNSHKLGSALGSVLQSIERTKTNIQWKTENEDAIFNWLNKAADSF